MSTYKHGGEKTKALEQTNVASMLFLLFIVSSSSIIFNRCIETGNELKYAIYMVAGLVSLDL